MKVSHLNYEELIVKSQRLEDRLDLAFEKGGKDEEFWHCQECLDRVREEIEYRETEFREGEED